jgi:phage shock protein E
VWLVISRKKVVLFSGVFMYRSFLFIFGFSLCVFSQAPKISQDSLKSLMTHGSPYDFLLIDVRNESELTSMIGNDICKPYNLSWPAQLQAECGKIGKGQVVFLYCKTGVRAQAAANYLDSIGFTNVFSAGGISAWNGATISKTGALPLDSLPRPSMKGTITSVIRYAPLYKSDPVSIKTFIPHTFENLYVKKGQTLFNLDGKEIVTRAK